MYKEIVDYIRYIYNEPADFIPLHTPCFVGNEKKYLINCIDSTYVSSVGNYVDKFEQMVADYTGSERAVVCVNGTNALHLALLLAGVERNDEVLTQPLTFVATCNAISYIGAEPVFLDVDLNTMGLSPAAVKYWLEKNAEVKNNVCYNKHTGRRIKACVPMRTFGHPMKITELTDICCFYNIIVVEDAAESIGSLYQGKHTGTFGKVGVISFNGNKTVTTGGGGMLLFNDVKLGDYAKHLTTQCKLQHKWKFMHDHVGYNYRMPNINAALGCAQMESIDFFIENKRNIANLYRSFIRNLKNVKFFCEPDDCRSNYWLNAIIFDNELAKNEFLEYSNANGVMTRPIWELMCNLPMFVNCQKGELDNSIWLSQRVVNIPSSVNL